MQMAKIPPRSQAPREPLSILLPAGGAPTHPGLRGAFPQLPTFTSRSGWRNPIEIFRVCLVSRGVPQPNETNPTDIPVAEPGVYMGCLGMGQACAGGSPHTKGGKPWVCLAPLTPENNKKIIIKK